MIALSLVCVAVLLALAPAGIALATNTRRSAVVYGFSLRINLEPRHKSRALDHRADRPARSRPSHFQPRAAGGPALVRGPFPHRFAVGLLPGRSQFRWRRRKPVRARLWPARRGAGRGAAVLSRLSRRHEHRGDGG